MTLRNSASAWKKAGIVTALTSAGILLAIQLSKSPFASRVPAHADVDPAFDESRPVHEFDAKLMRRIITPIKSKGELLLQNAVVPKASMEKVIDGLDRSRSIAWQMQMKYGLNEFTVSRYLDDDRTSVRRGDFRSGTSPNCFLCHSSFIENKFIAGLGNTRVDLRTFFNDLIKISPNRGMSEAPALLNNFRPVFTDITESGGPIEIATRAKNRTLMLSRMFDFVANPEMQSLSAGHSNPWSFAVILFNWRNNNMDYMDTSGNGRGLTPQAVVLDPMPWWLLKYKKFINWDAIIPKSPRSVIQAVLSPGKSGEEIRGMEPAFEEIFGEIHQLDPPVYPKLRALNRAAVRRGEQAFNQSCTHCHGIYSKDGVYYRDPVQFAENYPNRIVAPETIGTDPLRAKTVDLNYLSQLQNSWMGYYNHRAEYRFRMDKIGYLAPPLWGIWASAPYFHNGSVPTLKAVLFPELRPFRWKLLEPTTRSTPYDLEQVGLAVDSTIPPNYKDSKIFETTLQDGRSNAGHEKIFEAIDSSIRLDLFEYLKTL